jgi:hypothetical protein
MRAKRRQTRVEEKNFIESTDSKGLGGWRQDVLSFGGCIAAAHCKMPRSSSHLRNSQQVTQSPHSFAQAQDLPSHRSPASPGFRRCLANVSGSWSPCGADLSPVELPTVGVAAFPAPLVSLCCGRSGIHRGTCDRRLGGCLRRGCRERLELVDQAREGGRAKATNEARDLIHLVAIRGAQPNAYAAVVDPGKVRTPCAGVGSVRSEGFVRESRDL